MLAFWAMDFDRLTWMLCTLIGIAVAAVLPFLFFLFFMICAGKDRRPVVYRRCVLPGEIGPALTALASFYYLFFVSGIDHVPDETWEFAKVMAVISIAPLVFCLWICKVAAPAIRNTPDEPPSEPDEPDP